MKQKMAMKKKLRKRINGKFNNIDSADENKYTNITAEISSLSEAEMQGHLHPAKARLEYFLAWF
jgi:hypothetical protein